MQTTTVQLIRQRNDLSVHTREWVYIVRDGETVLYVGKTRWYSLHHRMQMHLGRSGPSKTPSNLGKHILENLPASNQWQVDIFSLGDINAFLQHVGVVRKVRKLETAEQVMIIYHHPLLNINEQGDEEEMRSRYPMI